jgi:eukaryotic-like serine/threonine-protein kinase
MASNPTVQSDIDLFVGAFQTALQDALSPDLTEYLPPEDHPFFLETLQELVRVELRHSWKRGHPISLEEYEKRFPGLFANLESLRDLAREEYLQRQQLDEPVNPQEYIDRFGVEVADWYPESAESSAESFPTQIAPVAPVKGVPHPIDLADEIVSNPNIPIIPRLLPENQATDSERVRMFEHLRSMQPKVAERLSEAFNGMPQQGDVFLGFRLIERLGEGSFGQVFRAEQLDMAHRTVALKVSADLFGETQSLSQLQHTNIMPVYSAHRTTHHHAICMPFFGKTTLADLCKELRRSPTLPTSGKQLVSTLQNRQSTLHQDKNSHHLCSSLSNSKQIPNEPEGSTAPLSAQVLKTIQEMSYVDVVLWMGARIADGLAHAHDRGIIHRDLKPANVLLTDEGIPMILDFNLSEDTKLRNAKVAVRVGGTLPFMSPEQLEAFQGSGSKKLDGRSDIYSLGLILFQLLTGKYPYSNFAGTHEEVIRKTLEERKQIVPQLRGWNKAISPAVESIVQKCLASNPDYRYQHATELRADLERHRANLPLKHAPNPSWIERITKWSRRHPRIASPWTLSAAIAAIALCIVTYAVGMNLNHQKQTLKSFHENAVKLFYQTEDQLEKGRLLLTGFSDSPEKLKEGVSILERILNDYQVEKNPNWRQRDYVQALSPDEQERLRKDVGEAAFLMARSLQLLKNSQAEKDGHSVNRITNLDRVAEDNIGRGATDVIQLRQDRIDNPKSSRSGSNGFADNVRIGNRERSLLVTELVAEGRYQEAIPILKKITKESSDDFGSWFYLARCYQMVEEYNEAYSCYSTCIALKPTFTRTYYNRALICERQGNLIQAKADLDQALRLDPNMHDAGLLRVVYLKHMKKLPEALEELNRIAKDPNAPTRTYLVRADIRHGLGDLIGAKEDREKGLQLIPKDPDSWAVRGYARLQTDAKGALADFEEAEKLDSRSIPALQNQAYLHGEVFKKPDLAVKVLDRLLVHHPEYMPAICAKGVYLARMGLTDEAINHAKQALGLNNNPYVQYRAACIYALASTQNKKYTKEAMGLLAKALLHGHGYEHIATDRDLDPLRGNMTFRQLEELAKRLQALENKVDVPSIILSK